MNVFACHESPTLAAHHLADKHVVKMTLESAQLLSTAARELLGGSQPFPGCYRATHKGHPCTRATIESRAYREWLLAHACALGDEYRYRFGREHKSAAVVHAAAAALERSWLIRHSAAAPLLPADAPRCTGNPRDATRPVVEAYRDYLTVKYSAWADARPVRYTKRQPPDWLADRVVSKQLEHVSGSTL